jgi:hypothetical protein
MRQKISILGILLIAALLLVGPASAASVIGHGSKTYHYNFYGTNYTTHYVTVYKWTAYKYTDYKVKQVLTYTEYRNGKPIEKMTTVTDVLKAGSGKVKVVETMLPTIDGKTYKSKETHYYHIKYGSAVRFYFTEKFKTLYLKNQLGA